uniref:Putative dTDP-4-dehydrorhamnose 3,5-epimerase n=1 Tax=viral metagenome TaxID=1070528 RepID=A0A6M3MEY5_9ZZZZ
MPFVFDKTEIQGVIEIEPIIFEDIRGFFAETYTKKEFEKNEIRDDFVQENCSYSTRGVLRGLHYQKNPHAQAKLVRCDKGIIYDVAVDIRQGSPTYGKWVGVLLSGEKKNMLYIPEGFAHGFCVLSDDAMVVYKASKRYSPSSEAGIWWCDEDLRIDWPVSMPKMSDKDLNLPKFKNSDNNFIYHE